MTSCSGSVDPSLVDRSRAAAEPRVSQAAPTVQRPAVRPTPDDTDGTGPISHGDLTDRTDPVPALPGATDPKLEPSWLAPPGPPPARSRRGPVLAAGGAVAVVALIAVGVLLLTRGSPSSTGGSVGTFSPSLTSTSSASASTTPTGQPNRLRSRPEFAGTWSGTATMSAIGDSQLGLAERHQLHDGERRDHRPGGERHLHQYAQPGKATATVLTFHEPGTTCAWLAP